ncbi:hypothetical protein AB0N19_27345, partial [Streptomyces sp. NPDC051132]
MDDTRRTPDPQAPRDASRPSRALPFRRLGAAVAGAAALVAVGVGVALAAPSDAAPRHERGVAATVPPDTDAGGTSVGTTDGGGTSDGSTTGGTADDGGLFYGGTSDGSTA